MRGYVMRGCVRTRPTSRDVAISSEQTTQKQTSILTQHHEVHTSQ